MLNLSKSLAVFKKELITRLREIVLHWIRLSIPSLIQ
jgi:hypothetical protein